MSLSSDYISLVYGLDEASGRQSPKKGRLLGVENYELIAGRNGLHRIAGYEAMDGRLRPSKATYYIVVFGTGTAEVFVGNTITTASGTAYVLRVALTSGTWAGGNAVGTLIVTALTGTMLASEVISVGTSKAIVTTFDQGSIGDTAYATDIALARTYYRDLITKPTGSGGILGVALFYGLAYCLRNATDGLTATLWKEGAAGWTAIRTGLRPGGYMRKVVANFTGVTGTNAMYGVDGVNRYWSWDGTTFAFGPAAYDTDGTSTTNVTPGTGAKVFTITEASRAWVTGQSLTIYSKANAAQQMVGTVTSWIAPTLTMNITSFAGAAAADWYVCRTDNVDRPNNVAEHKNYLFLVYPQGQIQSSSVGDPMTFNSTATLFAMGDEVRALVSIKGAVLATFGDNRVSLIYGDGSTAHPWDQRLHSIISNCKTGSAINIGGDAVYLADAGVLSIDSTQAFGDFNVSSIGIDAKVALADITKNYKCSVLIRSDSQYRIYSSTGRVLVMSFTDGRVSRKTVGFTTLYYDHMPTSVDSETATGEEIVIFGTDEGWVMRERAGTTFNGANIAAFFRTSYWNHGTPQTKKRWRKLTLDVDCGVDKVDLAYSQDIDFFNGPEASYRYTSQISGAGGQYDTVYYDTFFYDTDDAGQVHAQVDGVGRFMSLLVASDGNTAPHVVRGVNMLYSNLGIAR